MNQIIVKGKEKMQILLNTDYARWEVYGPDPVIRAGEPQPQYVSESYDKCITYRMAVEGQHDKS